MRKIRIVLKWLEIKALSKGWFDFAFIAQPTQPRISL